MLLLLLLISSGCDVNIPGCGKRSLPFFKPIATPAPVALAQNSQNPTANTPPLTAALAFPTPLAQGIKTVAKQPTLESGVEMSITKPKPTVTATSTWTATPQEVEKIAYTT